MKVQINYEVAEAIMTLIENNQYQKWSVFESEMDKIKDSEGIKLMIDFYKAFDFKTYKEVVFHALNHLEYKTEDQFLKTQHHHLKGIRDHKEKLKSKLNLIRNYDYTSLKEKLQDKLPQVTELDIEIFFVLDGMNGASIVGLNQMMINTMFWPSEEKNLELIEGILLHEYHHLGVLYWMGKHEKNFGEITKGADLAENLMMALMSEGAATYFFNDGHDLYPLILESHGEEMASAYRTSMESRGENIEKYLNNLEKDLIYMFKDSEDLDSLRTLKNKYTFNSTGEPLDKSIGYHMCSLIEDQLGLEKLVACIKDPD
jgi:hypothetical protein